MQLFVTPYVQKWDIILISNILLLHQCRKVLRMRLGDTMCVQDGPLAKQRHTIRIDSWDDKQLQGVVEKTDACMHTLSPVRMLVAMPNRWDKAELIVQKLSEIGVAAIGFWPAHRSVIKQNNDAKMERLSKIAQEATEQSWSWRVPNISFVNDIVSWIADDELIVFDKGEDMWPLFSRSIPWAIVWLIWPEWGLSKEDYAILPKHIVVTLGNTIYRTETASIVGGRYLVSKHSDEKNS